MSLGIETVLQRNPPVPPTVHIFGSPPSGREVSPPQVILLPLQSNATNEPALLLISNNGTIRFWPSIFLGLAGADRFVQQDMTLFGRGKDAESIVRAQPLIPALSLSTNKAGVQGMAPSLRGAMYSSLTSQPTAITNSEIIAGTSKGRIFRIAVSRRGDGGNWSVDIKQIQDRPTKSGGLFSGLFGFGSSTKQEVASARPGDDESVNSVLMGAVGPDGIDVWVLDSSSLSVWRISDSLSSSNNNLPGAEKLICKVDAISGIQEKLLGLFNLAGDATESTDHMYAEDLDVGLHMAGGLPRQLERKEALVLALGVELLDLTLVKSTRRTISVDPREPSTTPGSREDEMETEMAGEVEELTPVILVSYTVPHGRSGDGGGISWQSAAAPSKKGPKKRERSYATIACRVIGAEQLAGSQPSSVHSVGPTLVFENPSVLPYSDLLAPRNVSTASAGVSIGFGASKRDAKDGWFAPRLAALQAVVAKAPPPPEDEEGDDDDNDETVQQWQETPVTVLAAIFEGGMVFSANGASEILVITT